MTAIPQPDEYAPFYANYVNKATAQGNILETLERLKDSTRQFLFAVGEKKANFAYAEGKWTIKQLVSHMIDAERVFAYRVLCFSRGDENALPGFDENAYVKHADLSRRTLQDLADEFKALREANLFLFKSVNAEQLLYTGVASGSPVLVKALLYIIAGHELHHLNIIKNRYM
jgi:uncharacterized damage-inducible protein DinB